MPWPLGADGGHQATMLLTAQVVEEGGAPMVSTKPMSLAARERLRDHQVAATRAVSAHAAALVRLERVISRRTEVVCARTLWSPRREPK